VLRCVVSGLDRALTAWLGKPADAMGKTNLVVEPTTHRPRSGAAGPAAGGTGHPTVGHAAVDASGRGRRCGWGEPGFWVGEVAGRGG